MMNNSCSKLLNLLNKRIVLVGENHGVVENVQLVKSLVEEFLKTSQRVGLVGLEYPNFKYEEFMTYVDSDHYEAMARSEWGQILLRDGRFSKEHFELLKFLKKEGIKVGFFDSGVGSWDERDKMMAENLQKDIALANNGKIIIVAGNIHTNMNKMIVNGKPYMPMASYLEKDSATLVALKYHNGEFYNFGRREFIKSECPKELVEKIDEETIHFHIPYANPTQ